MERLAIHQFCAQARGLSAPSGRMALRLRVATPRMRSFATKAAFQERDLKSLKVNGTRLMNTLHETCEYGKAHRWGDHHTETGMARLTLNDDDKKVRHWLIDQVKALGCKVTVDKVGNMFAVRQGVDNTLPPIMMGSHYDTQPTGGRYDGILGVTAALEVLRTLQEAGIETNRPVGLVNWTNEEGARFPKTTMGSSVWAGVLPLQEAWDMPEIPSLAQGRDLRTFKEELERIGFLGDVEASHEAQPIGAHFELHIEQGPILEQEGQGVGVVSGGQAYSWYEIEVTGKDQHAGTTPFSRRQDAMLAAAKMMVAAKELAQSQNGLATVGIIHALPGSINTTAHTVKFTLDVRHNATSKMKEILNAIRSRFDAISEKESDQGVRVKWRTLTENETVKFADKCITAIEKSASAAMADVADSKASSPDGAWQHMMSGAGHDSCVVNKRAPSAMIFTRTRHGYSHTPDEYCSPEDCTLGAQVLLGAVLRFDLQDRQ